MSMTTLRAELIRNLDATLDREYLLFLDYDRKPTLITLQQHQQKFNPSNGHYGPYHCVIHKTLLDVPLYLGDTPSETA